MAQTNLQGSLEQTPLTPHMEDERRLHPPIDSPSSVLAHTNTGTRPLTVDDIKASPYYCLISARCKICEFEIAEGDGVVAILDRRETISQPFPFYRDAHFHDTRDSITFHMCMKYRCNPKSRFTIPFHIRCYEIRVAMGGPILLPAIRYEFEPRLGEDKRRANHIQSLLGVNLSQDSALIPKNLPLELYTMIASYLVHDSAAISSVEQLSENDIEIESYVDLRQPVYISYIKIDGQRYVETLSNDAPTNNSNRARLVLPLRSARPQAAPNEDQDVYVAHDQLGIRGIYFIPTRLRDEWCRDPPKLPGAWWKRFSRKSMGSHITICGDAGYVPLHQVSRRIRERCFKMRGFHSDLKNGTSFRYNASWPYPLPGEPKLFELTATATPIKPCGGLRMRYFECNQPDTIGYFVATDGQKPMAILSHRERQRLDKRLFDKNPPHLMYWMYMPINDGEYLTEIGVRTRIRGSIMIDIVGITFSTNRDRTVLFGWSRANNSTCKRVANLPRHPTRVFFNELDTPRHSLNVDFIAFEETKVITDQCAMEDPAKSIPAEPYKLKDAPHPLWQYTSCSLSNLREIQPCIETHEDFQQVVGMLLSYADGHRESVGQMRLDQMAEPISIAKNDILFFHSKAAPDGLKHIDFVTTQAPEVKEEGCWLEVYLYGTLEWWFWIERHVLRYQQASLNMVD